MTEDRVSLNSTSNLSTHPQVVVIGRGAIGCSVANPLTKLGLKDVVLLERQQLTSGTTWHAVGLVVTPGSSEVGVEMPTYTRELLKSLEEETGQSTGFNSIGCLQFACTPDLLIECKIVGACW